MRVRIGGTSARRRGSLTVELLLVLPILLAILLAMFEFSALLVARQELLSASREGARVAALGGDENQVREAVSRALNAHYDQAVTVRTLLTDSSGEPVESGSPVVVRLELPTAAAAPDLLRFIGISIHGETIIAQATMRKE
jgi:Flp pilus assembly protein TadG